MAAAVANLTLAEGHWRRKHPAGPGPEPGPAAAEAGRSATQPALRGGVGRDPDGGNRAAAAAGQAGGGHDRVRTCPGVPASGTGLEPAYCERTRIGAAANRIDALATALIAAVARRFGVDGLQEARK